MVKADQAVQIKQIMQIKQDKCRSSGSCRRDADQAGQVIFQSYEWQKQFTSADHIFKQ